MSGINGINQQNSYYKKPSSGSKLARTAAGLTLLGTGVYMADKVYQNKYAKKSCDSIGTAIKTAVKDTYSAIKNKSAKYIEKFSSASKHPDGLAKGLKESFKGISKDSSGFAGWVKKLPTGLKLAGAVLGTVIVGKTLFSPDNNTSKPTHMESDFDVIDKIMLSNQANL